MTHLGGGLAPPCSEKILGNPSALPFLSHFGPSMDAYRFFICRNLQRYGSLPYSVALNYWQQILANSLELFNPFPSDFFP